MATEEAGADAVMLINIMSALLVDLRERRVFLRGVLSGAAIESIASRAVYEASRAIRVPMVGGGGVARGADVAEFMLAVAAAVQVGGGELSPGSTKDA